VLTRTISGITEQSITRRPLESDDAALGIDFQRARSNAQHAARPCLIRRNPDEAVAARLLIVTEQIHREQEHVVSARAAEA
jgi:hypothetical protein